MLHVLSCETAESIPRILDWTTVLFKDTEATPW